MSSGPINVTPNDLAIIVDRIQKFRASKILHPKLIELDSRLRITLSSCPPNSVILVFGPSGVGKSTLREKVEKDITLQLANDLEKDRDRLPFVSVEAQAPESGMFNWRQHFMNVLLAMDEPLISQRTDRNGLISKQAERANLSRTASGSAYQTSVELAIKYRKPMAVFIDEAQHIAKVSSAVRMTNQQDIIKSMANRTQTPHVLVGHYDLLAMRNLNGQLARRSFHLHYERYHLEKPEEAMHFRDIIYSFCQRMPFSEPPDILRNWEFLCLGSVGCVGILKDWLVRALFESLRKGNKTLELPDLESTQMEPSKIAKLLTECKEGEESVLDDQVSPTDACSPSQPVPTGLAVKSPSNAPSDSGGQKGRTKTNRPGNRKPKRDQIGRGADVAA